MKVLVIGPSDTKSRGGMATVIRGIRDSKVLNEKYNIDIFASYIDGNIVSRLIYSAYSFMKFLCIYKKYDLFHIHTASFGSTFRKRMYLNVVKKANKKVIIHIHGAKYLVFFAALSERNKKKVTEFLKSADMVIALSNNWKQKFEETFGLTNCVSLPNGIDNGMFSNAICDLKDKKNDFLMMGRLGERKGTYDLVYAVSLAVKENPRIKVYLAGDGEIEKVKKLVAKKNLEHNIEVVGWVDFNGKIALLKKSAVLVLPSYNEGMPMAVLEAMASGKAIISTTVGAIPEVIKEENGILIEPGDVKALSAALVKCSQNAEMLSSMSKNNIEKINKEFSLKIIHERLCGYYNDVANI